MDCNATTCMHATSRTIEKAARPILAHGVDFIYVHNLCKKREQLPANTEVAVGTYVDGMQERQKKENQSCAWRGGEVVHYARLLLHHVARTFSRASSIRHSHIHLFFFRKAKQTKRTQKKTKPPAGICCFVPSRRCCLCRNFMYKILLFTCTAERVGFFKSTGDHGV